MKSKAYFVTGIGTDVGKTVVSAVLVEKLKADYWKLVQAGDLGKSDTIKVKSLISNNLSFFHKEAYRLNSPMSPHAAAKLDGVEIELNKIEVPVTENSLIVEGAGGLMVPLNERQLLLDWVVQSKIEVIVVVSFYLGSINHTLLTLDVLKNRGVKVKGIIANGEVNEESLNFIINHYNIELLGIIPKVLVLDKSFIKSAGKLINI